MYLSVLPRPRQHSLVPSENTCGLFLARAGQAGSARVNASGRSPPPMPEVELEYSSQVILNCVLCYLLECPSRLALQLPMVLPGS